MREDVTTQRNDPIESLSRRKMSIDVWPPTEVARRRLLIQSLDNNPQGFL